MKQILESQFQEEVKEHQGLVLVDFFTEWCGYCHMLTPVLEEIDKENGHPTESGMKQISEQVAKTLWIEPDFVYDIIKERSDLEYGKMGEN